MVCVLRNQHLGQQACFQNAFVNDLRGHWCLNQALALGASPLAVNVALNCGQARRVVELFADVLTDAL